MIAIGKVGGVTLSKNALVAILVICAIDAGIYSWQRCKAIQAEYAFRVQMRDNLNDLLRAADEVAARRK